MLASLQAYEDDLAVGREATQVFGEVRPSDAVQDDVDAPAVHLVADDL